MAQAIERLYETEFGNQRMDLSSTTIKFQTSLVIQQDPNKSGILSFLEKVEEEIPPTPTRTSPQTVRPTRRQGGY